MTEMEISEGGPPYPAERTAEKHASKAGGEVGGEVKELGEEPLQRQDTSSYLPLPSKARTIALVMTLTGVSHIGILPFLFYLADFRIQAAFLNTLTVQAVVIVLPTIGKALDIPASRQQWVVSAYSLSFGCFLLLWGRLADVYGKRLIFILGSLWVAILTLVNPFADNEIVFDLLRGLQGLGGAANVPTAIGILATTFPPGKARNYAFSFYAAGAPMGSVMG